MSTTQNDDLLILSEDDSTLDFGLEESASETKKQENDFGIFAEDESPFLITEEETTEENSLDLGETSNKLDLGDFSIQEEKDNSEVSLVLEEDSEIIPKGDEIDFSENLETKEENELNFLTEEEKTTENEEVSENLETKMDLGDLSASIEEKLEKTEEKNFEINSRGQEEKLGDMSEILSRTIGEFKQREELIDEDISEREAHILDLEKELNTEKELVSGLKNEKTALEKNRKSIEKMKADFEKKEEKTD